MKTEAELCTVIRKALIKPYKIADESAFGRAGVFSSIRPFDGIGLIELNGKKHFLCWEAKYLKTAGAFSFKRLQPWQNEFLAIYSEVVKSFVLVGINYGRADIRVFAFDWNNDFSNLYLSGFSIHKKYMDLLPYNKIQKNSLTLSNIISYSDLKNVYEDFDATLEGFKSKNGSSNI